MSCCQSLVSLVVQAGVTSAIAKMAVFVMNISITKH